MADRNENDQLQDEQLIIAVLALADAEALGFELIDLLNDTEPEIAELIRKTKTGLASRADYRKLGRLLRDIRQARGRAWRRIRNETERRMNELAREQPIKLRDAIREVLDRTNVGAAMPTEGVLKSIIDTGKVEGRTIAEWLDKQQKDDEARITNQVIFGLHSMESPNRIVQRVFGTADVLGANGATEEARRRLFEITVLSGLFVAGQAKAAFVAANEGLVDREKYVAVLDSHTTKICRSLNGKIFRIGEGPYPPIHFWCRSTRIFLFPGEDPGKLTDFDSWLAGQPQDVQAMMRRARANRSGFAKKKP